MLNWRLFKHEKRKFHLKSGRRQSNAYRSLVQKLPNGHAVDASQLLEDVVRDVQRYVLDLWQSALRRG